MKIGYVALLVIPWLPIVRAQDGEGKMAFEVASIKLSKGELGPIGVPDDYSSTNGRFQADATLSECIEFAYKLTANDTQKRELSHLPKWAFTDRYRIDARAPIGNPNNDQMRLMVQSLLAERFQLAVRFEDRELRVLELELTRPGKLGPKLVPHSNGPPCDQPGLPASAGLPGFACHSFSAFDIPGIIVFGSRDITMDMLTGSLSLLPLGMGRPIIDKTGLTGRYDLTIEWAREPKPSATLDSPPPAPAGPTLIDALRDQLGLKLEASKATLQILVIDQAERPSEN